MKLNEHSAILTTHLLLVPYCSHHVPTYHEWMQDEELQKLTASEPLTLPEEYSMQASWRQDADKLTFIVCTRPTAFAAPATEDGSGSLELQPSLTPGQEDTPDCMIGDVNLFLYPCDDDDGDEEDKGDVVGELEIMIARTEARGKGLAKEALQAFIWYVLYSLPDVMGEYKQGSGNGKEKRSSQLKYLRVKIDKDNVRSLGLFENLGFRRVSGPNYFGEVELRLDVGNIAKCEKSGCIAKKLSYGHA